MDERGGLAEAVDHRQHGRGGLLHPEQHAGARGGIGHVEDVIEALGQTLQVLAVDGGDEGARQRFAELIDVLVAPVLEVLHPVADLDRVGCASAVFAQHLRRLMGDLSLLLEKVVKVGLAWQQAAARWPGSMAPPQRCGHIRKGNPIVRARVVDHGATRVAP